VETARPEAPVDDAAYNAEAPASGDELKRLQAATTLG
jgi:hypothetical protein